MSNTNGQPKKLFLTVSIVICLVLAGIGLGVAFQRLGMGPLDAVAAADGSARPDPYLSAVVNSVEIQMRSIEDQKDNFRVEFCFHLPTNDDWQLRDATITAGERTFRAWATQITHLEEPVNAAGELRCIAVLFAKPDSEPVTGEVTVQVDRLITSWPDPPDCVKAQEKLDRANTGIRVGDCRISSDRHGSEYDIYARPESMSDEEMYKAIADSFSDIVDGPWIFQLP
jgi:hypothetical protein